MGRKWSRMSVGPVGLRLYIVQAEDVGGGRGRGRGGKRDASLYMHKRDLSTAIGFSV